MAQDLKSSASFFHHFDSLEDPRIQRCQRHKLGDILFLAVCAMLGGANDFVAMEKFGHAKRAWLDKFLELPNGIPSHDTLGRVFSLLDSERFIGCFVSWVQTIHQVTAGEVVAVDGKTARASLDRANGQNPLHVVSAWASANRVVLGEVMVDEKSNEITAIPKTAGDAGVARGHRDHRCHGLSKRYCRESASTRCGLRAGRQRQSGTPGRRHRDPLRCRG